MDVRSLNPHDVAAARRWWSAMSSGAGVGRIAPLIVSEDALLESLRSNATNPNTDRRAYASWSGQTCLGTALIELPRRENQHLAEIDVVVPAEQRRRGFGAALFRHTLAVAQAADRTTITDEINVPMGQALPDTPGGRFALARGFVSVHTEQRLLLDIPVPKLDELETLALERSAKYQVVSWLGLPPHELSATLAAMHTQMERDVPIGDLDREPMTYDAERLTVVLQRLLDQGYAPLTTLALDETGRAVAYTMMLAKHGGGADVIQDDTFVLPAHRGHRLAIRVKAANLRELDKHRLGARYVHTWTAEVNDAMRTINERFGFRAVETMHEVQLSLPRTQRR